MSRSWIPCLVLSCITGCSGAAEDPASSASADTATSEARPSRPVLVLGQIFAAAREGLPDEAAAHALEPVLRREIADNARAACAKATKSGRASTRLVGVGTDVFQSGIDSKWIVEGSAQQAYCATEAIDDALVVTFDSQLSPSAPIARGSKLILDIGLQSVVDDVSQRDDPGPFAIAVRPHALARFDGGDFGELGNMPAVHPRAGDVINISNPLPDRAATLLDVPATADRFEIFLRVERWSYKPLFREDGNFTGTATGPTSDAFVSNFGQNYRLPVH